MQRRRGIASWAERRRGRPRSSTPWESWDGSSARRRSGPDIRRCSLWESKEEAARALAPELHRGDVVLLKASRAMALETIMPELKD